MTNFKALCVTTVLLISTAASASEPCQPDVTQAAKALDAQSKSSLGVSLRALTFLFDADPGTFLLKEALQLEGTLYYVKELERAGYAKVSTVKTADGEFVQIVPTDNGQSLRRALAGP